MKKGKTKAKEVIRLGEDGLAYLRKQESRLKELYETDSSPPRLRLTIEEGHGLSEWRIEFPSFCSSETGGDGRDLTMQFGVSASPGLALPILKADIVRLGEHIASLDKGLDSFKEELEEAIEETFGLDKIESRERSKDYSDVINSYIYDR